MLRSGSDGHWGLSGMRERAERVGARLNVRSSAGAGTEVELLVPGRVAFARKPQDRPRGWMTRFRRFRIPGPSRDGEEKDV